MSALPEVRVRQQIQEVVLTLDELGSFGVLESLEEQDEDLFPVLGDRLSVGIKAALVAAFMPDLFTGERQRRTYGGMYSMMLLIR